MAKKRDFTISDVYIMPKSILQGTASKEFVAEWKKDLKSGKWRKNYKKYLVVLLLFICLCSCSCVTRKGCERKFPNTVIDSILQVTNTVTIVRDTTIYVRVSGDTVFRTTDVGMGINEIATPLARSYAWVEHGKLQHRLVQKDTLIPYLIRDALRNTVTQFDSNRISYRIVKVNELNWWQRFWIGFGKIFLTVLIISFTAIFFSCNSKNI